MVPRLAVLLAAKPLMLAVKASEVRRQYERVFLEARILTDLRPVFGDAAELPLVGAVVAHNLKLTYAEHLKSQEFFVTLDDEDLLELQKALARAVIKSKVLRASLHDAHVTDLDSE